MTQLSLFPQKKITDIENRWQLFVDGASRNNPGLAGAGVFVKKNNKPVATKAFFLNNKTNNEAEYLSLILGLLVVENAQFGEKDFLEIISDSELLVNQILGKYRVKKPELQKFFNLAKKILNKINYNIKHTLRENNKEADKLANEAIDKKSKISEDLLSQLDAYGITI
ncbi:hypothetical protein A3F66_03435 [candidate division TM6 bacterium RIFCSPHIGHO2_12_FULL_32_22]|nr:MAG: hypothetical protein A3F66_03435 [candidate division TM6 bacterium RIFCSPHIGHO2_12_FULL_32_22]